MNAEIEALDRILREATTLRAVFGPLPSGSPHEQRKLIRKQFLVMAKSVHPDLHSGALKKRASEVFQHLSALWDKAEGAILTGTYESVATPIAASQSFDLSSSKARYTLAIKPFKVGMTSTIYRGDADGVIRGSVLVKVAHVPTSNPRLENEARILGVVHDAPTSSSIARLKPYFPHLVDTFLVEDGARRLRGNTFALRPGYVSVRDILKAFPRGSLAPQDAAWIARRVIAQALAAQVLDAVHGSIIPEHILVHPSSREPLHIGWSSAQKVGALSILAPPPSLRAYYPDEVLSGSIATTATDVYMAAQVVRELFGIDAARSVSPKYVPREIVQLLTKCTTRTPRSRPSGRDFLDEFTRLIRKEWGRTYRPLVLPGS